MCPSRLCTQHARLAMRAQDDHRESPLRVTEHALADGVPWIVSRAGRGALLGRGQDLQAYLRARSPIDVADVGYTLAGEPEALGHRAVLTGRTAADFLPALDALERGAPALNLIEGFAERAEGAA